jgi:succinate dehydrogenase / fumarate reductase membrane anchor subunit
MSPGRQALAAVLGRGSAHSGAHHWRMQRVTAIALVPLTLWFLASLLLLPDLGYLAVREWLAGSTHAVLASLLLGCLCWHSALGVQVVIEDYVHGAMTRVCLLFSTFAHVVLAAFGLFAILRTALPGLRP